MDITTALEEFQSVADPKKAAEVAKYHKVDRPYLGISNPDVDALVKNWRDNLDVQERVDLAAQLWDTNIYEPRVAAAKLLVQQRMRPDDTAWAEIQRWVPEFDSWAIADHACSAGARRLIADPSRLDDVAAWTTHDNMWVRRAALVITLPWTKQNNQKPADLAAQERILGWAGGYPLCPNMTQAASCNSSTNTAKT